METRFSQRKWLWAPPGLTHMPSVPAQKVWGLSVQPCRSPASLPAWHSQRCCTGPAAGKLRGKLPCCCRAPAGRVQASCRPRCSLCSQTRACWRPSAATVTTSSFHRGTKDKSRLVFKSRQFFKPFPYTRPLGVLRGLDFPVLLRVLQNDRGTPALPGHFTSALNGSFEAFQDEMLLASEVTHNC